MIDDWLPGGQQIDTLAALRVESRALAHIFVRLTEIRLVPDFEVHHSLRHVLSELRNRKDTSKFIILV